MIAKKSDYVDLIRSLYLVKDLKGKKFSLVVSKNITLIQDSLKELENKGIPSPEFIELSTKMHALANEGGDESKSKMEALEGSNIDLIEARKLQISEIKEALEEEIELDLSTIEMDDIPEDISPEQLLGLNKIIV